MSRALDLAANRHWTLAGGIALTAHAAAITLVVTGLAYSQEPPVPEPVMLIELPPAAAPAAIQSAVSQPQTTDYVPPRTLTPPMDIPQVRAPLPSDPVTLPPPPPPQPARQASAAQAVTPSAPAPVNVSRTGTGTGTSIVPGNDPKAKQQEADYFSLVSAHLNRKKKYPTEARKAMQQGIVTVRFTVSRDGAVSNVSIKKGSSHAVLDQATLDLMQRVAPLPKFPQSMARDSVTLSLPIDYSLKTS